MHSCIVTHQRLGLIPLHQQVFIWGVSKKTKIAQRADNQIVFLLGEEAGFPFSIEDALWLPERAEAGYLM